MSRFMSYITCRDVLNSLLWTDRNNSMHQIACTCMHYAWDICRHTCMVTPQMRSLWQFDATITTVVIICVMADITYVSVYHMCARITMIPAAELVWAQHSCREHAYSIDTLIDSFQVVCKYDLHPMLWIPSIAAVQKDIVQFFLETGKKQTKNKQSKH